MLKLVLRWVGAVVLIVVLASFVGACGSDDDEASPAAAESGKTAEENADLQGEVTIGAVFPTTGASATIGEDQARGAELAVEKINSGEGVLGKKIAVAAEDSQSETVGAVQAARKLVSVNKVPLVVSEYISARTIAAGKYLNKSGIVQINPGSSSTEIADVGEYTFSSIALDNIAGKFAAQTLYDAGHRRMAFLGPNNPYGAEFARVVADEFEKLGGEVTESILYTEGESTYRAELERLKNSNPDVYVYASYVPDAITINEEAFELGIDPATFYGIYLSICIEDVDAAATAGQHGQDLTFAGPHGREFADAYQAKYGEDVRTPYSAYVYDAILMAAAAINEAGSEEPDAIRDTLDKIGRGAGFEGATGTVKLDADGERVEQEYGLFEVDDEGKMQEVDAIPGPES